MKKILFISNDGGYTGAPIFLVKLIKHLRAHADIQLSVLFVKPGPLIATVVNEGVSVVTSEKSLLGISRFAKLHRRLSHYFRYCKLLLLYRPNLVYSNTIVNFGEVILAGCLGIPVLLHMHEGSIITKEYRFRLRLSCFFANEIITGSEYVAKVLKEVTGRNGIVIYNGLYQLDCVFDKKTELRNPVLLGIIGTVVHNKGQKVVIQAVEILAKKGRAIKLKIAGAVGDKLYFDDIVEMTKNGVLNYCVDFLGPVANSSEFISSVDIVVVPSFDEALPTVILEAFSLGIPVVASNVGGIPEIIQDGVNGFLFDKGNSIMLADCLESIIQDSRRITFITSAASQTLNSKFDAIFSFNHIEEHIRNLLG